MALEVTYDHSTNLQKLTVNGSVYWLKDADLRALVESFGSVVYKDVITTFDSSSTEVATSAATAAYIADQIADLEGAMHFRGVIERQEGETDAQAIARVVTDPEAGDVVIMKDNGKEYIYGDSWEEVGDQNIYLTIAAASATYTPLTREIAGLSLASDITDSALKTALGLKALAYKSEASGTVTVPVSADDISAGAAGTYTVNASSTVAVPLTYNAMDVTPAGSVTVSASVAAAATYDKVSGITVTAVAADSEHAANYTPAGTVSLPAINAGVTLESTSAATVTDSGTGYSLTDGSVSQAADATAKFIKKGVSFTVDASEEALALAYVTDTSDAAFFADAVTAAGAVTYTAPTLSGALPTFGTVAVAQPTGASASATYAGDASFNGTGTVIGAAASFNTANATVTQPTYTAAFVGTSASVTPTAATTDTAIKAASVTVDSSTVSITLNTEDKTVTVS